MAIIQMAAAKLAAIDELVYHTFNNEGTRAYEQALVVFNQLAPPSSDRPLDALLQALYQLKYQWGYSDGN